MTTDPRVMERRRDIWKIGRTRDYAYDWLDLAPELFHEEHSHASRAEDRVERRNTLEEIDRLLRNAVFSASPVTYAMQRLLRSLVNEAVRAERRTADAIIAAEKRAEADAKYIDRLERRMDDLEAEVRRLKVPA